MSKLKKTINGFVYSMIALTSVVWIWFVILLAPLVALVGAAGTFAVGLLRNWFVDASRVSEDVFARFRKRYDEAIRKIAGRQDENTYVCSCLSKEEGKETLTLYCATSSGSSYMHYPFHAGSTGHILKSVERELPRALGQLSDMARSGQVDSTKPEGTNAPWAGCPHWDRCPMRIQNSHSSSQKLIFDFRHLVSAHKVKLGFAVRKTAVHGPEVVNA